MRLGDFKIGLKGTLLLSAVIVAPAAAQSLMSLDPAGGWSVTRMKDSKAADYCALSRPYDNNSVLTLARNETREYSLAVDFQSPTFDPEKPYALTLQPGLGQLRAYEVLPTSPSTFVVRLGLDEGFLDALAESNELKLQVAKDKYTFKITEFGGGLNDLESCMTGLPVKEIAPAPVKEAKAATPKPEKISLLDAEPTQAQDGFKAKKMTAAPAMPVPEVKEAKKQTKAEPVKQAKAKTVKAEPVEPPQKAETIVSSIAPRVSKSPTDETPEGLKAEDLLGLSETKSGDIQFRTSKSPRIEKEPDVKTTAKPTAQEAVEVAQALKPEAAKKPEPKTISKPAPKVAAAPSVDPAALKATERALELQKIQTQKAEGTINKLEQDLAVLQNKNDELRVQANDVLKSKDINQAKDEKKRVAMIADLQAKLEAAKADNIELSKQLDEARLGQENKLLNEASGDWTLEKATKRYNEAEREIQRLALELESQKTSCRARTTQIENMLFDPAVAEKEQITRLMTLEKELETARAQLNNQNEAIEQRVAQRLGQRNTSESELQAKLKTAQDTITSLQSDLATLRKENAQQSSQLASTETPPASPREVSALKTQVQVLTRQLGESEQALAELKKTKLISGAALTKTKEVEQQIANLNSQLVEAKKAEAAAKDQAIISKNELERFRAQITQTQSTEASRADRLASLKIENDRLKSQLSLKDKESTTFRNQLAAMQQDLAQTKSKLGGTQARDNKEVADNARLKQEVQSLRQQLSRKDQQYQKALTSVQQDNARLEQAMASTSPSAAAQQPRRMPEPSYAQTVRSPQPASAPAKPRGFTGENLKAILASTGAPANAVRQAGAGTYQWNNGGLNGQAVIKPASVGAIDSQIQNYIAQEKSRCNGDFASMPTSANSRTSYEIACITQGASQSSSVLFFEKEGSFVALSYKTDAADMDLAMDARDRLASHLTTMRTSSTF